MTTRATYCKNPFWSIAKKEETTPTTSFIVKETEEITKEIKEKEKTTLENTQKQESTESDPGLSSNTSNIQICICFNCVLLSFIHKVR